MKLYYAPGTCALACWIALEWASADYAVEKVDPKSDAYKAINPLGMVPALDIGGERAMTQADAILQHIARRFPAVDLGAGGGEQAEFEFHETMAFLTGDVHPAFWPFFTPERFTTDDSDAARDAIRASAPSRIARVFTHLDQVIGDTGHVFGGRRTVADAYAFVMARWSEQAGESWRKYPHLAAFMTATQSDLAVRKVLERSGSD